MVERRFLPLLAAAGALIVAHQALDLVPVLTMADLATPTGRLGAVALLWTRGPLLLVADFFLMLAVGLAGWKRWMVVLAAGHLLAGAAALAEAPWFLADAGQMAGTIATPELPSFRITVARILTALIVLGVGALVAGAASLRIGRPGRPAA